MKINIGIDTKRGFCEVVIDSDETKPVTIRAEDLIGAAETVMADITDVTIKADKTVVIDGKAVTTYPCDEPGCRGTVMCLAKRTICNKCGKETKRNPNAGPSIEEEGHHAPSPRANY